MHENARKSIIGNITNCDFRETGYIKLWDIEYYKNEEKKSKLEIIEEKLKI